METGSSSLLQPVHDRISIGLGGPDLLVEFKILEDRLFTLQHECHAARGLGEGTEMIPKRVGLMVTVSHLVPPVVNFRQAIMCSRDGTNASFGGEFLRQAARISVR